MNWLYTYAPWYYLILIVVAELLVSLGSPQVGLAFHMIILMLIPVHYSLAHASGNSNAPMLLTVALAPLIRILSLSLPLANLPLLSWYVIIALPLFASAVVVMRVLGISWRSVSVVLHLRALPLQLVIGMSGLVLGYIEFIILHPRPLVPIDSFWLVLVGVLAMVAGTGVLEEFIFRGIMQYVAIYSMGKNGIIYVSILFAALHIGYLSVADLIFVFFVGLFFAWAVLKTGSIVGVAVSHSLTNIVLYFVMPFIGTLLSPW